MTVRRPTLLLALLALVAACDDGSTGLENIAEIRVTPANPSIDVGLTVQFQAQALDANGQPVPNVTFTWRSSDSTVARVSESGIASALKIGTASITASAGSAPPGSQPLVVQASQCTNRVDVVLSVGQHQAYDGDQCLFLPTGSVGDRYRVAVIRPTLIEDPQDTPDVWLTINPILTAEQALGLDPVSQAQPVEVWTEPAVRADLRGPLLDGTRFVQDAVIRDRTRRFHAELRQRELDLGLRTRGVLPSLAARASGPSLVDPPARDDFFLVIDCEETADPSPVVLIDFSDNIAIYQDSVDHASSPLSTDATDLMVSYFDQYVVDMVDDYWGQTPDIDGNQRVLVTTTDALPDSAAAGVFSGDFRDTADCSNSNEAEIIYFSTEVLESLAEAEPSYIALSILAHEMKHVTSLYNGIARGAFHNIWVEEGTAEISQVMSSRIAWAAVGGPAVGSAIEGNDIIDWNNSNGEIGPEAWGVVSEIADVIVQLNSQPNSLITNPEGASEFHTFYAAGWHWHRFIGDAFGDATTALADSALFREMTDSLTPASVGALAQVTGRSFDELFEDLVVAMSFHQMGPLPARDFSTWNFNTAAAIFQAPLEVAPPGRYPWPVTGSATGSATRAYTAATYSCPLRIVGDAYQNPASDARCPMGPSGIRFHDFTSGGEGLGAQVQVFGAPNGRLIVTRLN